MQTSSSGPLYSLGTFDPTIPSGFAEFGNPRTRDRQPGVRVPKS
jgi:hypothetical protein